MASAVRYAMAVVWPLSGVKEDMRSWGTRGLWAVRWGVVDMREASDFGGLDVAFSAAFSSSMLRISLYNAWPAGVLNSAARASSSVVTRGGMSVMAGVSTLRLMRFSTGIWAELFTSSRRSSKRLNSTKMSLRSVLKLRRGYELVRYGEAPRSFLC